MVVIFFVRLHMCMHVVCVVRLLILLFRALRTACITSHVCVAECSVYEKGTTDDCSVWHIFCARVCACAKTSSATNVASRTALYSTTKPDTDQAKSVILYERARACVRAHTKSRYSHSRTHTMNNTRARHVERPICAAGNREAARDYTISHAEQPILYM